MTTASRDYLKIGVLMGAALVCVGAAAIQHHLGHSWRSVALLSAAVLFALGAVWRWRHVREPGP